MLDLERVLARSVLLVGVLGGTAVAMPDDPPLPDTPTSPQPEPMPPEPALPDTTTTTTTTTTPTVAPTVAPTYVQTADYPDSYVRPENTFERYGMAMALGGGVQGFTNQSARDTTKAGGDWNVRVAFGTKMPIGIEAAYIGSAQSIDALGLDTSSVLVGNGVEGLARVNLVRGFSVQPFAFAGIGWRHYSLANTDTNTSDIQESDDVLEIPMGAGLAYTYRGFLLDARGEFRYSAREDLMPSLSATDPTEKANLHRWGVNANIGVAF